MPSEQPRLHESKEHAGDEYDASVLLKESTIAPSFGKTY
jgi:hypothetical protein